MAAPVYPEVTPLKQSLKDVDFNPDGSFKSLDNAKQLLDFMVSNNTGSAHDLEACQSTVPFVQALEAELQRPGVEVHTDYEAEYPKGVKQATLVARIWPKDKPVPKGGVVLSSHVDVIPVTEPNKKDWFYEIPGGEEVPIDPFRLTEVPAGVYLDKKDPEKLDKREPFAGGLTARGANDMKQALVNIEAITEMYTREPERLNALEKPIYIALSWGEELGCMGAPAAANMLAEKFNADPDLILVGEPTGGKPVIGHKGASITNIDIQGVGNASGEKPNGQDTVINIKIKGKGGHSGYPENYINAGKYAANLILDIEALQYSEAQLSISALEIGTAPNAVPDSATLQIRIHADDGRQKKNIVEAIDRIIAEDKAELDKEAKALQKRLPKEELAVSITKDTSEQPAIPAGANAQAIHYAAELTVALNELQQKYIRHAREYVLSSKEEDAKYYDRDFPNQPYPCVNVGVVKVANAGAKPDSAKLEICTRSTGKMLHEEITADIKEIVDAQDKALKDAAALKGPHNPDIGIKAEVLSQAVSLPSQDTAEKMPLLNRVKEGLKELGRKSETGTEAYCTDGGVLAAKFPGALTLVCGEADIKTQRAHKPNEYITPEQLLNSPSIPLRMIYEFCLKNEQKRNHYPEPWMMPTAWTEGKPKEKNQAAV